MITRAIKTPYQFVDEYLQDVEEPQVEKSPAPIRRRLSDHVTESLRATGYFVSVPCEITVRVDRDGRVSLQGIVPTYYLKQKAQAAAMSVDGVASVQNDVVVLR